MTAEDDQAADHVRLEVDAGVATITLNRPSVMNALTSAMMVRLLGCLEQTGSDPDVRAVILTGAGRAFSAGGDVGLDRNPEQKTPWLYEELVNIFTRPVLALVELAKPVIAAVNGYAVGGGWDLALSCDIRIAGESARFRDSYVQMGALPELGGSYWLPRLAGLGRAKMISFTGDVITASQAQSYGLVEEVVPDEQLLPTVRALATRLAQGPTKAIALTKQVMNAGLDRDLRGALEHAKSLTPWLLQSADHHEAAAAFFDKRPPRFTGR